MKIFGFNFSRGQRVFTEKKKVERLQADQNLFVDYRSPVHLTSGSGEARDISTRGIRFACYSHYPVGTPLDLKLRLLCGSPAEKSIQVHAFVVRCYRKPMQRRYRVVCALNRLLDQSVQDELITRKGFKGAVH